MRKSSKFAEPLSRELWAVRSQPDGADRMGFRGRLEQEKSSVDADGVPPVIHRDAYDGTHKRVDAQASIWVVSQECSSCPMMG